MLDPRTQWNISPNKLSRLVEEKRLRGETIIDLTESNPTQCGFSYPKQEILNALANESALIYQPQPCGLLSTRAAIAEHYAKHGRTISADNVVLTASTSEAYSFLFKLLCSTQDRILTPQPGYPLFEYLSQLNDIELCKYRLKYDGEWHIDFDSLTNALTNRTKIILLIHPNNPTGSYIKQDEFNRICMLADKHDCAVIVDEVFESYNFSEDKKRANIAASQLPKLIFSLGGISKLLGLPQLKLSWIIVQGNSQLTSEALNRLEIISDTYLSVNGPVQEALPKLFQYSNNTREQIHKRVETNYRQLVSIFTDSKISVFQIEGGWYSILQLPQIYSDEEWAFKLLHQNNIYLYPGYFFDMEQKSCIVVSLLPDVFLFHNALLKIKQSIDDIMA